MFSNKPTSQRQWPSQTILNLRCPEVWFNLWNTPAYGLLRLPWRPATPFRDLVPCVSSEAVCAFKIFVHFSIFQAISPPPPRHFVVLVYINCISIFGSQLQNISNIYIYSTPNYNTLRSILHNPPHNTRCSVITYIFFYGSTNLYGHGPPRFVEVSWSHIWDTPQSVGLLWTREQLVAETSTWHHTTLTTDRHPCPRWDSNPRS
jgi:hypothetical protein